MPLSFPIGSSTLWGALALRLSRKAREQFFKLPRCRDCGHARSLSVRLDLQMCLHCDGVRTKRVCGDISARKIDVEPEIGDGGASPSAEP